MNSASALKLDAIRLQRQNYEIVPLNPSLHAPILELEQAIRLGILGLPDLQRRDFYDVDLSNGWAYIHVRDEARAVYLVAYSSSGLLRSRNSD
jgi:hypothetical protein